MLAEWRCRLASTFGLTIQNGEEEVEKSEERGMGEVVMRDADVASCRQVESSARPSGLA